ncbi:MAG: hypothetical protein AAGF86_00085 [Pseudomonadota bacterium]
MASLLEDLRGYDGKAITLLSEAAAKHGGTPAYLSELVALCSHDELPVSEGATWLLKANLENGVPLPPAQTETLLASLGKITHWPAQLHLCQMLHALTVPEKHAAAMAGWLSGLLTHKRPFLRAWSMSALQSLAAQHPAFEPEAKAALKAAKSDTAASVRARARNLDK